jgi:hypothetical protein
MPLCPHCQSPYEEGQRYCDKCDSYLLDPEEGNRFCPQCGIRVAAKQEVCHKCNASLPVEVGPAPSPPTASPVPEPKVPPQRTPPPAPDDSGTSLPLWAMGVIIAAGVVIVALVAFIILRPSAGPSPGPVSPPTATTTEKAPQVAALPKAEPAPATTQVAPEGKVTQETPKPETAPQPSQTGITPAPAVLPAATLEDQIKETLNNLREAQLKQDIILFMSCYSYIYPTLDKKRRDTQAYWHEFNFLGMDYTLDEVKPVGQDTALARVTWTMQVQSRRTQLIDTFMQSYEVGLAKELGKWRIRSIKEIEED